MLNLQRIVRRQFNHVGLLETVKTETLSSADWLFERLSLGQTNARESSIKTCIKKRKTVENQRGNRFCTVHRNFLKLIDFVSHNWCEDFKIGALLRKAPLLLFLVSGLR